VVGILDDGGEGWDDDREGDVGLIVGDTVSMVVVGWVGDIVGTVIVVGVGGIGGVVDFLDDGDEVSLDGGNKGFLNGGDEGWHDGNRGDGIESIPIVGDTVGTVVAGRFGDVVGIIVVGVIGVLVGFFSGADEGWHEGNRGGGIGPIPIVGDTVGTVVVGRFGDVVTTEVVVVIGVVVGFLDCADEGWDDGNGGGGVGPIPIVGNTVGTVVVGRFGDVVTTEVVGVGVVVGFSDGANKGWDNGNRGGDIGLFSLGDRVEYSVGKSVLSWLGDWVGTSVVLIRDCPDGCKVGCSIQSLWIAWQPRRQSNRVYMLTEILSNFEKKEYQVHYMRKK
jgi:hypothetical protein